MKNSGLKFKELTRIANSQPFTIDLFNEFPSECSLLVDETAFQLPTKSRPQTSQCRFPTRRSSNRKAPTKQSRSQQESCLAALHACLPIYLSQRGEQQKKELEIQFQQMLKQMSRQQSMPQRYTQLRNIQSNISKHYRHRLMHLLHYLCYNRFLRVFDNNDQKLICNMLFCEQYSRIFRLHPLTLIICLALQQLYISNLQYELSRIYAQRALKMAVITKNHHFESYSIHLLCLLDFYQGKISEYKGHLLEDVDRSRISHLFNEKHEIETIAYRRKGMEEEVDNKWEERLGTFGKQIKANENVQYFCKNSHDIANKVRSQQIDIRLSMGKVASVGDVKKYLTDGQFIMLRHEDCTQKQKHCNQVMLTHGKSFSRDQELKRLKEAVATSIKILTEGLKIIRAY